MVKSLIALYLLVSHKTLFSIAVHVDNILLALTRWHRFHRVPDLLMTDLKCIDGIRL